MALSLLRSDLRFQHVLRRMSFPRSAPFGLNLIRAKTMRAVTRDRLVEVPINVSVR